MDTSTIILMVVAAIIAITLMVLGLSITLLRKGRNMQSDIGDNDAMRSRGIECAAAQMRREEAELRGEDPSQSLGCGKGECSVCAVKEDCE